MIEACALSIIREVAENVLPVQKSELEKPNITNTTNYRKI